MKNTTLKVTGMHCKSCEMLVEDDLNDMGVKSKASSKEGTINIEFDESKVKLDKIKEAIEKNGYKVK